ncbi:hypothetical protein [Albibacterium profundi]|uniref:Glycoside hydrolase 123 catalytic domain-containing protein n=1 Tax=Albibacterium profundi TaxID=3134906 RepID=A0ABV5CCC7_9SPHI
MWLDQNSLGWANKEKVIIDLRFENPSSVGQINVHSALNNQSDVFLPINVFAYSTSDDFKTLSYLGDMIEGFRNNEDKYRRITLSLKDLNVNATGIRLVVFPNGPFFFADEIIVKNSSQTSREKDHYQTMNAKEADDFMEEKKRNAINLLFSNESQIKDNAKTVNNEIEFYIVDEIWGSDLSSSRKIVNTNEVTMNYSNILSHTNFYVFKITNTFNTEKSISYSFESSQQGKMFTIESVRSRNFKIVPDAIFAWQPNGQIILKPHETKTILLAIKNITPSSSESHLRFSIEGTYLNTINFNSNVLPIALRNRLNLNTWAYFNYPFAKGIENKVYEDLIDHGNNIFVVPPSVLFNNRHKFDLSNLNNYVSGRKDFDKILLYLDFKKFVKKDNILNDFWKKSFLEWYDKAYDLLRDHGYDEIYLYPYDELDASHIKTFEEYIEWIKSVRSNVKIFATINQSKVLESLNRINSIDIIQLKRDLLPKISRNNYAINELWIYDTKKYAKSLSPYSYYRLMAWEAFFYDAKGIGFWNYADVGNMPGKQSAWDDFDGNMPDFNFVYKAGKDIISSRRWEATRKGLEDYEILLCYEKMFGSSATRKLCEKVIRNSDNVSLADNVINEAIEKIKKNR